MQFDLPAAIHDLVVARNKLRETYRKTGLTFTLDGNLIGDLGEAIAAELFDLRLEGRNARGIDARDNRDRTVQIKATGTGRGAVFRPSEERAAHLLVLDLDLENLKGTVVYNGPEEKVLSYMSDDWRGQRLVPMSFIKMCDADVNEEERLKSAVTLQAPSSNLTPIVPVNRQGTLCPACNEKNFILWPVGWDAHAAYACRGIAPGTPDQRKTEFKKLYLVS